MLKISLVERLKIKLNFVFNKRKESEKELEFYCAARNINNSGRILGGGGKMTIISDNINSSGEIANK